MTNMRPRAVIASAFGIRPDRIVGSPAWFDRERFDISARAPANTPDNQLPLMLRTLLAERFRLVVHTEMHEQPVYALVVARPDRGLGPGLRPSTECDEASLSAGGASGAAGVGGAALAPGKRPCTVITSSNGRDASITGGARRIDALVGALQGPGLQGMIERPVTDRTGLAGTYDIDLRFAAASLGTGPSDVPTLPSIFTAVEEQLGLKLEPARGPIEMFVIDSVERPTPD